MKKITRVLFFIVFFVVISGAALLLMSATKKEPPFLPGITVKDDHPNGCVDCHKKINDKLDYRLNVSLGKLEGHPKIDKIVKNVPKDCFMCHKEGAKAGKLELILHKAHFHNPKDNHFISNYNGACLNCHSFDEKTGSMPVKTGSKNW
ncbi:MAG: hypothetical protein JW969_12145 [Spirochaetales bacterium]|nr:hypothetical protein [Spirochaetales bacterium]